MRQRAAILVHSRPFDESFSICSNYSAACHQCGRRLHSLLLLRNALLHFHAVNSRYRNLFIYADTFSSSVALYSGLFYDDDCLAFILFDEVFSGLRTLLRTCAVCVPHCFRRPESGEKVIDLLEEGIKKCFGCCLYRLVDASCKASIVARCWYSTPPLQRETQLLP